MRPGAHIFVPCSLTPAAHELSLWNHSVARSPSSHAHLERRRRGCRGGEVARLSRGVRPSPPFPLSPSPPFPLSLPPPFPLSPSPPFPLSPSPPFPLSPSPPFPLSPSPPFPLSSARAGYPFHTSRSCHCHASPRARVTSLRNEGECGHGGEVKEVKGEDGDAGGRAVLEWALIDLFAGPFSAVVAVVVWQEGAVEAVAWGVGGAAVAAWWRCHFHDLSHASSGLCHGSLPHYLLVLPSIFPHVSPTLSFSPMFLPPFPPWSVALLHLPRSSFLVALVTIVSLVALHTLVPPFAPRRFHPFRGSLSHLHSLHAFPLALCCFTLHPYAVSPLPYNLLSPFTPPSFPHFSNAQLFPFHARSHSPSGRAAFPTSPRAAPPFPPRCFPTSPRFSIPQPHNSVSIPPLTFPPFHPSPLPPFTPCPPFRFSLNLTLPLPHVRPSVFPLVSPSFPP
ncbi:unnamed protein product [Closterium sp. NIES-64]|nr:unnamed protein product [Closterium sp. NIES-64]